MYNFIFIRIEEDPINYTAEYLITDHTGKIIEYNPNKEDIKNVLSKNILNKKLSNYKIILIIPDLWTSFHIAEVPAVDYKKRLKALPYILEDRIISNIENTIFAPGPEISKNKYLVAVADKEKITKLLNHLKSISNTILSNISNIISDAISFYKNQDDGLTKLYLNKDNTMGLAITNNSIIILPLNNLDSYLDYHSQKNITVAIYKKPDDKLLNYVSDTNISKLSIAAEHEISDWLPFIAQSWLNNRNYNKKDQINLASPFITNSKLDINFNKLWFSITVIWLLLLFIFVGYKYYDTIIFDKRLAGLNKIINNELALINIKSSNLQEAKKTIQTRLNSLENAVSNNQQKEKFFLLLSAFAESSLRTMKISKINFDNEILELHFTSNQHNQKSIEKIKQNILSKNIKLKETIKTDQAKTNTLIWHLSL